MVGKLLYHFNNNQLIILTKPNYPIMRGSDTFNRFVHLCINLLNVLNNADYRIIVSHLLKYSVVIH